MPKKIQKRSSRGKKRKGEEEPSKKLNAAQQRRDSTEGNRCGVWGQQFKHLRGLRDKGALKKKRGKGDRKGGSTYLESRGANKTRATGEWMKDHSFHMGTNIACTGREKGKRIKERNKKKNQGK